MRLGAISGAETPEDDDEVFLDDQYLFDEIYSLADLCSWFDTDRFVDSVFSQFETRRFITTAQRDALIGIRDMLEEQAE